MTETPNYPWYEIGQMDDLQQGDLLFNCSIINSDNSFNSLKDGEITEIEASIDRLNLIILSHSCDLANDKIEQVLLCGFNSVTNQTKHLENNKERKKRIEDIEKGRLIALCLIEESDFADVYLPSFEKQVIEFRAVYTLPKNYVLEFVKSKTRARLLPPYREYVAQAFARFFMRVGLPMDFK